GRPQTVQPARGDVEGERGRRLRDLSAGIGDGKRERAAGRIDGELLDLVDRVGQGSRGRSLGQVDHVSARDVAADREQTLERLEGVAVVVDIDDVVAGAEV